MDILEKDILDSISIIREKSKRPDAESIFKHLSSTGATNITMEVVQESIRLLIAKSKVVNRKTKQGLDSFFIADCQLEPEIEISDITSTPSCLQKGTPNETVGMSGETPKLRNLKTPSLGGFNIEDFTARVATIKAFFMNEIYELKQQIESLKQKVCCGENFSSSKNKNNIFENLELQFSLLQHENNFLKREINQKQKTIDKLLDLNWIQSKDQYKVNDDNKTDRQKVEILQLHNGNPSVNVYDVNKKQSHNSGKPKSDNIKIKSNGDSKTKIMVVGDSLVKYLRREELSSKKLNVKVITHPGSTTEDMLDYIKPIARRKPDTLIIHAGTNDLTNDVNTMKKVRKLVKVVREIDEFEKIKIGFFGAIYRKDKDLEDERDEVNMKLMIENGNINESGLNNSKLHLNKKGTNILTQDIKRSFNQF